MVQYFTIISNGSFLGVDMVHFLLLSFQAIHTKYCASTIQIQQ